MGFVRPIILPDGKVIESMHPNGGRIDYVISSPGRIATTEHLRPVSTPKGALVHRSDQIEARLTSGKKG